jgi:protein-tyrosine phosphatase
MKTATPERVITLENVHNFRDLGGYRGADGRMVRWRTLFRADGLQRLSSSDVEVLRPLGLRTVIDLRTATELDERGRFPVDDISVTFHHLPVIDATAQFSDFVDNPDIGQFLSNAYDRMLDYGAHRLGEAIRVLSMAGTLPAVFHCAAGKDRTGLLAALTLAALGVSDSDIVADYALTEAAMLRARAWLQREQPESLARMNAMPAALFASQPAAMGRVLADLRLRHGSLNGFLDTIGVDDRIRFYLREGLLL